MRVRPIQQVKLTRRRQLRRERWREYQPQPDTPGGALRPAVQQFAERASAGPAALSFVAPLRISKNMFLFYDNVFLRAAEDTHID